jgi:DNA-directed RNA polymerase specialized sigma24 family protein
MLAVQTDELSVSQAARVLGLSSSRVIQLCNEQRLACRRTALGRLIPAAAVSELAIARDADEAES